MVPAQVTIIPEYFLMMKLNWLDSYLPLIIPSFLVGSFGTFMFKEFYETFPSSISDAGIIDGAGAFRMFTRIYLPQSGPQAATLFIIAFMNSWNDLLRPILYISDDSMQTVTMALTQFQSQYTARWNLLLAGGVISVMPLLLIFVFLQRYIIENSINSGIKG
jgi:multiple sugar transport system permease protein